jgi:bifunctional UDP-N-acetylglucosamine pyrophosphorylase/glucosamine-1-phosphate N-acetyltransferase
LSRLDYVIVLAAGEGTRLKSTTPKVLHSIAGHTLLGHVLIAVEALAPAEIRVVVGSGRELVSDHIAKISPNAIPVIQDHRGGTGHAVQLALAGTEVKGTVLIVAGDTPLLSSATLRQLIQAHNEGGFAATVLTAELPDPAGYGRIIRTDNGDLLKLSKSATPMSSNATSWKSTLAYMSSIFLSFTSSYINSPVTMPKANSI